MGLIDHTYAVVAAIEQYAHLGDGWKLVGVTAEAVRFTEWLIKVRGLRPSNVHVFFSGDANEQFRKLGISAEQIANATSELVSTASSRV